MVTSALPLNVRALIVEASIALFVPSGENAMFAEFKEIELVKVIFENLTRRVSPPIETLTICRKVLLDNAFGGVLLVALYGEQAHVPTQCFPESELDAAKRFHEPKIIHNTVIAHNE